MRRRLRALAWAALLAVPVPVLAQRAPQGACQTTVVTQDITVSLDAGGSVTITAAQVDDGSTSTCGITAMSVTPSTFTCADTGPNTVTLTVTDGDGQDHTGTATVTVEDDMAPVFTNDCGDGTPARPFTNLNCVHGAASGTYTFDIGGNVFQGYVDGTTDGGGWVMILNYVHQGGTNPALNPRTTDLPLLGSSTLGANEAGTATWGHAAPSLMATLNPLEVRFYGQTSNHARVIHFRTSHAGTLSYIKTGSGSMSGIQSSFSALPGHTASIPASANAFFSNQGNEALTNFPYYQNAAFHWGIRGLGGRWEVDDWPNNSAHHTIHRVFVRGSATAAPAVITVNTTAGACEATVTLNAPATDNCSISSVTYNPSSTTFPVGSTTVIATATDSSGNSSEARLVVRVIDNELPAVTTQSISVSLSAAGTASITPSQVITSSSDNCGIASSTVTPNTFTCANRGNNTVVVRVTDVNGNVRTVNTNVTVVDDLPPTAIGQNLTVRLRANGTATITAAQIEDGSTDNCGVASVSVSPNSFTCANVGANTVTLTVTDVAGNVDTAQVMVTVQDESAPTLPYCGDGTASRPITNLNCLTGMASGTYWFDINDNIFQGYVDGTTDGGGWLMILNYVHQGGTNPVLNPRTASLPLLGSSALGANEAGTATWGHAAPALLGQINFTEVRFHGQTSNHSRVIDFRTNHTNVLNYIRTGSGSMSGLGLPGTFTTLPGHTANIPAANNSYFGNQGNLALTEFPYYRSGAFHWGIRGQGGRWEVDDFPGNASNHTIHRVYVRGGNVPAPATGPDTVMVSNDAGACGAVVNFTPPTITDNCGTPTITYSQNPGTFFPVGSTDVTVTATDAGGNAASYVQRVTVSDTELPTALTQDISITIPSSGTATITAADIDDGSGDNCGIDTMSVSPNSFTTADAGPNTVTLTVTDVHGNTQTATATVTVVVDLVVDTPDTIAAGTYNNILVTGTGHAVLGGNVTINGSLVVQSGGVLDGNCFVIDGPGSFALNAGATLWICHAQGISGAGPTGMVQVTGGRSYASDASYVYDGTSAQNTGPGLPSMVRNLTIDNPAGVDLAASLSLTRVLTLTGAGDLRLGENSLTLLSNSTGTAMVANLGTGAVVGTATAQRWIDPSSFSGRGYRHFSSPMMNSPVADLATAGFTPVVNPAYNTAPNPLTVTPYPNVFGFDESRFPASGDFTRGYFSPASLTSPLVVGRGYSVHFPGLSKPDFVGTLNTGDITVPGLTRTGSFSGNTQKSGWHLLGNPYPSPLDWDLVTVPAGMSSSISVWRPTGTTSGVYLTRAGGTGSLPDGLIAMGQGFFARVTGTGPVSFTFPNAARVTTYENPSHFRVAPDRRPMVRLSARAATDVVADEAFVYFEPGATAGVDAAHDGEKPAHNVGVPTLVSLTPDGQELAVNGLSEETLAQGTRIPLLLDLPSEGSYVVEATRLANLAGVPVALVDGLTKTRVDLAKQTRYAFQGRAGLLAGRFWLEVNVQPAADAAGVPALTLYPNPASGNVRVLGTAGQPVELFDALGRLVHQVPASNDSSVTLPLVNLPAGVYSVRCGATTRRLVVE